MPRLTVIDRLPKEIREEINRLRVEDHRTIDEILTHLKTMGVSVVRSTLGLHVKKMDEVGRRIREARAVAEGIAPTLAGKDDGQLLNMNVELLHGAIMQIASATDEDGKDVQLKPSEAMAIGKALECAAKAAKINADRVLKIKQDAAEETKRKAASEVGKLGKSQGWSPDTVKMVRETILKVA